MVYTRAAASDYDDWETVYGNKGWGSKDIIPLLKKVTIPLNYLKPPLCTNSYTRRKRTNQDRLMALMGHQAQLKCPTLRILLISQRTSSKSRRNLIKNEVYPMIRMPFSRPKNMGSVPLRFSELRVADQITCRDGQGITGNWVLGEHLWLTISFSDTSTAKLEGDPILLTTISITRQKTLI